MLQFFSNLSLDIFNIYCPHDSINYLCTTVINAVKKVSPAAGFHHSCISMSINFQLPEMFLFLRSCVYFNHCAVLFLAIYPLRYRPEQTFPPPRRCKNVLHPIGGVKKKFALGANFFLLLSPLEKFLR